MTTVPARHARAAASEKISKPGLVAIDRTNAKLQEQIDQLRRLTHVPAAPTDAGAKAALRNARGNPPALTVQKKGVNKMAALIEESEASPEVLEVYADIKATRKTDWVTNFWKALANHPVTLKRMWDNVKQVMAPGALDPLTKELIYVAISITNNCNYCIASHTASARAKGMTDEQLAELLAVTGLANETNRLAIGYNVPVDERFLSAS